MNIVKKGVPTQVGEIKKKMANLERTLKGTNKERKQTQERLGKDNLN